MEGHPERDVVPSRQVAGGEPHDGHAVGSSLEHLHEDLRGDHEVETTPEARVGAGIRADRNDLPDTVGLRPPHDLVEQFLLTVEGPDIYTERPQPDGDAPDAGAQLEHRLGAKRWRGRPPVWLRAQAHPQAEISGVPSVLDLAPSDLVAHPSNALWGR
jgi:hypothetical protein